MSDKHQKQSSQVSIADKWNQLKEWMKDLRFPLFLNYPSKGKMTKHANAKIRGVRISWSASDNACMNFFSGAEIRKGFVSHWEHLREEVKKFKDVYWEEDECNFRLFLKNPPKEKLMILYLGDITEVTRVVFYFKYQLQLKKNIKFYQTHVDLPTVWKTAHFYQPLLERMRRFAVKFARVPPEELQRQLEEAKQLQKKKQEPQDSHLVESRLDVALIKETVADNYKQITFQILDFQIVGAVIVDSSLVRSNEIGPLRVIGPGGMNEMLREMEAKQEAEESRGNSNRKEKVDLDFKRQITMKQKKRKLGGGQGEVPEESEESENLEFFRMGDSPKEMSTQPNLPENIPSFKKNKPIKNNIFANNANPEMFSGFLKKMERSEESREPRSKSLNTKLKSSGTFFNASERMKRRPRFMEATGGQIDSKRKERPSEKSIGRQRRVFSD